MHQHCPCLPGGRREYGRVGDAALRKDGVGRDHRVQFSADALTEIISKITFASERAYLSVVQY